MPKRNVGLLPAGVTYRAVSVSHDVSASTCANCGRAVKSSVVLEDTSGNRYSVWMDCAGTLTDDELENPGELWQWKKDLASYKTALEKFRKVRRWPNTVLFHPARGVFVFAREGVSHWSLARFETASSRVAERFRADFANSVLSSSWDDAVFEAPIDEKESAAVRKWVEAGVVFPKRSGYPSN